MARHSSLLVAGLPVRFRRANGRYTEPRCGVFYEVTPPGRRKPLAGEIPKEYRRSIRLRLQFVAAVLIELSRLVSAKKAATQKKRAQARISQKRKKKRTRAEKREIQEVEDAQEEALEEEDLDPKAPGVPKLSRLVAVRDEEVKLVLGRDVYAKQKHKDSRVGVPDFQNRQMVLRKMHVDFDSRRPVEIFSWEARATALSLREYFRPYAEKFMDEMRGRSEEAYILRVKTLNRIAGESQGRNEGIGTERFRVSRQLPPGQEAALRDRYPGLSKAEILRRVQHEQLGIKLADLFDYFVERYENYLGRRLVESLAVTGFSMEVVEGLMVGTEPPRPRPSEPKKPSKKRKPPKTPRKRKPSKTPRKRNQSQQSNQRKKSKKGDRR
jgi:hypothetical protein